MAVTHGITEDGQPTDAADSKRPPQPMGGEDSPEPLSAPDKKRKGNGKGKGAERPKPAAAPGKKRKGNGKGKVKGKDQQGKQQGEKQQGNLKSWQEAVLKLHNQFRCMHGAPAVTWSAKVAEGARTYIAHLSRLQHDNSYQLAPPHGPAGENLAFRSPSIDIARDVHGWYDEVQFCQKRSGGFSDGCQRGANGFPTGHFTAVVWRGVTKIGCAKNNANTILICRYWSGNELSTSTANMQGHYVQNVLPARKSAAACKAQR